MLNKNNNNNEMDVAYTQMFTFPQEQNSQMYWNTVESKFFVLSNWCEGVRYFFEWQYL
jgi:hypothetical protein